MHTRPPYRLGVLGSGKGSNFVAIADACSEGRLPAQVAIVLSDVEGAGILEKAQVRGICGRYMSPGGFRTKLDSDAEARYVAALREARVNLVVLAGFMRILKTGLLSAFPRQVVNIHPSLLPAFPGLKAWEQAWAYGVKVTGCTVHLVDDGIDTGPVLGQRTVPVLDDDTPGTLHERIQAAEHVLYPEAIGAYLSGGLAIEGRRSVARR